MRQVIPALVLVLSTGCTTVPTPDSPRDEHAMKSVIEKAEKQRDRSITYVSFEPASDLALSKRVAAPINSADDNLSTILRTLLRSYRAIPMDQGVDLAKTFPLRIEHHQRIGDVLDYLSGLTGYDYDLDPSAKTIRIRSFITRSWNLSALSRMPKVNVKTGQLVAVGGTSNQSADAIHEVSIDNDSWNDVLDQAQSILGLEASNDASSSSDTTSQPVAPFGVDPSLYLAGVETATPSAGSTSAAPLPDPWLMGEKRLGIVTAGGPPAMMKRLDDYLSSLDQSSIRQVHMSAIIANVVQTSGEASGVDWTGVFAKGGDTLTLTSQATDSIADAGLWSVNTTLSSGRATLNALVQLLGKDSDVQFWSRPHMTTHNGYTVYLGSGVEFSYTSDIEQGTDAQGNITVTQKLARISVGLKIAVTPRIRDDGLIVLEVLPVISSVQNFRDHTSNGETFQSPDIALHDLATQVVVRSGEPVILGGLLSDQLSLSLQRLPGATSRKSMSTLVESIRREMERKELVIIITPTEVNV